MIRAGSIVQEFVSKSGKRIVIRYPRIEDVEEITRYINEISREDTYITFSGEQLTIEEERQYIEYSLQHIQLGNKVLLVACDGNTIIGNAHVERSLRSRKRELHVGLFGISLAAVYRNDGIGHALAAATINEAKKNISGLKQIRLDVYAQNSRAIALYHKLGFEIVGRIPEGVSYKGRYMDKIIMVRKLQ